MNIWTEIIFKTSNLTFVSSEIEILFLECIFGKWVVLLKVPADIPSHWIWAAMRNSSDRLQPFHHKRFLIGTHNKAPSAWHVDPPHGNFSWTRKAAEACHLTHIVGPSVPFRSATLANLRPFHPSVAAPQKGSVGPQNPHLLDGIFHLFHLSSLIRAKRKLTHNRPAMPFGDRKKYFWGSFQFSIVTY